MGDSPRHARAPHAAIVIPFYNEERRFDRVRLVELASDPGVELVVSFIDPAFQCAGATPTGLDRLSFGFIARLAGVTSSFVVGRSGPHLGGSMAGTGDAELTQVDDRYVDWDGGTVFVTPGGMVRGEVHYRIGPLAVDGPFVAPYCAALDVVAAP